MEKTVSPFSKQLKFLVSMTLLSSFPKWLTGASYCSVSWNSSKIWSFWLLVWIHLWAFNLIFVCFFNLKLAASLDQVCLQCALHPFNHQRSHRPANGLIRPLLVLRRMPRRTQVLLYFELTANMRQSLKYSSAKKNLVVAAKDWPRFFPEFSFDSFLASFAKKMWFFFKVVSDNYSRERLDYVWSQSCH